MIKGDDIFEHIHHLIKKGELLEIRSWLDKGGIPNLQNKYGWSLLMLAAMHGRTDIVELLIQFGANPNLENKFGHTAKSLALLKGHKITAKTIEWFENATEND
jgi:ankyrin repeat protein